jgi:hypothetical protein
LPSIQSNWQSNYHRKFPGYSGGRKSKI